MTAARRIVIPPDVRGMLAHVAPVPKRRIREALRHIEAHPEDGKALERKLAGLRSYAVPPWRIVYRVSDEIITVATVGLRKDVYQIVGERLRDFAAESAPQYARRRRGAGRPLKARAWTG